MKSFLKRKWRQINQPPGILIKQSEERAHDAELSLYQYNADSEQDWEVSNIDEVIGQILNPDKVSWLNVNGLNAKFLEHLGHFLDIHPLTLEDIMDTEQRPKMEDFDHYIYIIINMMYPIENGEGRENTIEIEQLSIILTDNYIITFQEHDGDVFDYVRKRIKENIGRIRRMHSDYLAYSLIDAIVDNYFILLDLFIDRMEKIQQEMTLNISQETLNRFNTLKQEAIFLEHSIWPLREVISLLQHTDSSFVKKHTRLFLSDLSDHTMQVLESIDTSKELLSSMMDSYLSSSNIRMNQIMKTLTIISTIFLPMTFIAGWYGMNFHNMPELSWKWGYPLVVVVTALIAVGMVILFKRKKWY